MKLSTFLANMRSHDEWGIQRYFDKEYEGSCPCFDGEVEVDGYKVHVEGDCWRVSTNAQDLTVITEHPKAMQIARAIKRKLDAQKWYNPYTIILEPTTTNPQSQERGER